MSLFVEYVVLVDEQNQVLGTMPKAEVHGAQTPLHRAFSSFIFNSRGELLLQQRAHTKKTWPLVWSNSCCGHPTLEESPVEAARRRLFFELGLDVEGFIEIAPYRYCFTRHGVMENEICPIVVGKTDKEPQSNPDEVEAVRWMPLREFVAEVRAHPENWSEWCVEETEILYASPRFREVWEKEWGLGAFWQKDWKKELSPDVYHVTREQGTEAPFSGKYWNEFRPGMYTCSNCGEELFVSGNKFDAGCGWPSFDRPSTAHAVSERVDTSHGMVRREVICTHCGAHLGHVFEDGPQETTGQRYCINSLSLKFSPKNE